MESNKAANECLSYVSIFEIPLELVRCNVANSRGCVIANRHFIDLVTFTVCSILMCFCSPAIRPTLPSPTPDGSSAVCRFDSLSVAQAVTDFIPQRPEFDPRPGLVGFVVYRMAGVL